MTDEKWDFGLSEYIKQGDLSKIEKTKTWEMAIGLQEVDGLKPSKYLLENAKDNIEGKVNIKEVESRVKEYYKTLDKRKEKESKDFEEADKVSIKIAEILSDNSFSFSPSELINIHEKLFEDVFDHAGKIRDYNITKEEWVLNGESVIYSSYENIMDTLKYDFNEEKNFSYKNLTLKNSIKHICQFTSNIWQVHPFCEGNTRTVAVFIIKYLKTFGFDINDEMFAKHSWYFRNSLVRANYRNFKLNVFEDMTFIENFFYNLLSNANYELKNRYTHIDYKNENENHKKINDRYSFEEQAIINLIKIDPNINQNEIAEKINKSLRTVKIRMQEMQEKNMITRENGKRRGKWIINE